MAGLGDGPAASEGTQAASPGMYVALGVPLGVFLTVPLGMPWVCPCCASEGNHAAGPGMHVPLGVLLTVPLTVPLTAPLVCRRPPALVPRTPATPAAGPWIYTVSLNSQRTLKPGAPPCPRARGGQPHGPRDDRLLRAPQNPRRA